MTPPWSAVSQVKLGTAVAGLFLIYVTSSAGTEAPEATRLPFFTEALSNQQDQNKRSTIIKEVIQ